MKLDAANRENSWSVLCAVLMMAAQGFLVTAVVTWCLHHPRDEVRLWLILGSGLLILSMIFQNILYWKKVNWAPPGTTISFVGAVLALVGGVMSLTICAILGIIIVWIGLAIFIYACWTAPPYVKE